MPDAGRFRSHGMAWLPAAVVLAALLLLVHRAAAGLPTNGMVLYYSFDTDSGATVPDESGRGHDGAVSNAAWSAFGVSRGAFRFHGSNDHIRAGDMAHWTNFSEGFSLAFWYRQIQPEVRGAWFAGTTGGGGALTNRVELGANFISQGELFFRLYDSEGNLNQRRYWAPGVDNGEWHHVALLVGTNPAGIRLLLDGVELAPSETSGTVMRLARPNFPLVLGTAGDGAGGISATNSLNGYLDDFRIFDRLLTTNEARAFHRMMEGEPDDNREQARMVSPGQVRMHTMKSLDDEDWSFFYTFADFTNYTFSTKHHGTNVDTRLTVYRALEDGTLGLVTSINHTAMGSGLGESWTPANTQFDLYFVQVTTPTGLYGLSGRAARRARQASGGAGFGEGSEYQTELLAAPMPNMNIIYVVAAAYSNRAAASTGYVGSTRRNFHGATALAFTNLAADTYSVGVTFLPGVRPLEHPTRPGQVQNPNNGEYGNPRAVPVVGSHSLTICVFRCEQVNHQRATVRDAHTGAHLEGVAVSGVSTSPPFLREETRRGHAYETSYQQPWHTLSDGSFPTNLMLYPATWNLVLSAPDYLPLTLTNVATARPWGHTNDLGEILLVPVDLDGNGIADAWERRHFPPARIPIRPSDDEDEDGLDNWSEYMAGTDPTLAADLLQLRALEENEALRLYWTGRPWRRYRVSTQARIGGAAWGREPDTVMHWGTSSWEQVWSDVNWKAHLQRVYRLEVQPP